MERIGKENECELLESRESIFFTISILSSARHIVDAQYMLAGSNCLLNRTGDHRRKRRGGSYPQKALLVLYMSAPKLESMGQITPTTSFVNKVLLEHTGTQSCMFTCERQLLSHYPVAQSTTFTSGP